MGAGRKPKDPQARSFEETAPTYNRPQVYLTSIEAKNELPAWDRMKLLKSARWLLNNSGLAQRIVRGISRYSVGSGLVPQARTSDREWNKRAEQLFEDRVATDAFAFDKSAAVNFYEAQRMIVEQMVTDGEMFAQLDKSEAGNAMARFITAEYVGDQSNNDAESGFHDGIKVNEDNKPVFYRVLSNPIKQNADYIDVPAADMIHIRKLHRYGFLRGVSWLCSSVSRIQDLRTMMENEQLAANLNSKIGIVIESQDAGNIGLGSSLRKVTTGTTEEVTFDRLTAGTGSVQLKPGEKLSAHTFDRPNVNFSNWMEYMVREIAWSAGISPELIWNMSGVGGAVARHILQDAEVFFSDIRQVLEFQFCRRFWRYWIWNAIRTGELPYPGDDWWRSDWIAPQRLTVDTGRDGKLRLDLVRAGLLSPQRYFNELGQDSDTELEDIIRNAAVRKRMVGEIAAEEGVRLTVEEVFPPAPGSPPIAAPEDDSQDRAETADAGETPDAEQSMETQALTEVLGVAVRAGVVTPSREVEAAMRTKLDLPEMSADVIAAWNADGGVRRPITLSSIKGGESEMVDPADGVDAGNSA